jgi:type II secretory pathway component PulJ
MSCANTMKGLRVSRTRQLGLSLVELMVGIAIGMFVVAAAATLVATQLSDNRRLVLEVQVQQDLRATSDIIARDLRRIGVTGPTTINESTLPVWDPENITPPQADILYSSVSLTAPTEIQFRSSREIGQTGPFGYKVQAGVIRTLIPSLGEWMDVTDADAINVTNFAVSWHDDQPEVRLACPLLCSDGTKSCWPTIKVRELEIVIKAESRSDPSIVREIRSVVRLRNDLVDFKVAPLVETSPACPS